MTDSNARCNLFAPSSTPLAQQHSENAIFSDDSKLACSATPPSSPPAFPWEQQRKGLEIDHPERAIPLKASTQSVANVFSVLGKRKPLTNVSDNARPKKQQKPLDAKSLTQMQMRLGQKIQRKCKLCGMEYVASSEEDRKLHDKFHKQSIEGCDMGKNFVNNTSTSRKFKGVKSGDFIVELDCYDHGHRRNKGQAALEVVQKELGAVPLSKEKIWDKEMQPKEGIARYHSYLYLRGTKCVGYLLVESIHEAYRVLRPDAAASQAAGAQSNTSHVPKNALEALRARKQSIEQSKLATQMELKEAANQPIQVSKSKYPSMLGVSRIWTSSQSRGEGIATSLLNTALECCKCKRNFGGETIMEPREKMKISSSEDVEAEPSAARSHVNLRPVLRKELIAFSQPTDSGAKLARKWFGRAYGWSVYTE